MHELKKMDSSTLSEAEWCTNPSAVDFLYTTKGHCIMILSNTNNRKIKILLFTCFHYHIFHILLLSAISYSRLSFMTSIRFLD